MLIGSTAETLICGQTYRGGRAVEFIYDLKTGHMLEYYSLKGVRRADGDWMAAIVIDGDKSEICVFDIRDIETIYRLTDESLGNADGWISPESVLLRGGVILVPSETESNQKTYYAYDIDKFISDRVPQRGVDTGVYEFISDFIEGDPGYSYCTENGIYFVREWSALAVDKLPDGFRTEQIVTAVSSPAEYGDDCTWYYYLDAGELQSFNVTTRIRYDYGGESYTGPERTSIWYPVMDPVYEFGFASDNIWDREYKATLRFDVVEEEGHPERIKYKATLLTEGCRLISARTSDKGIFIEKIITEDPMEIKNANVSMIDLNSKMWSLVYDENKTGPSSAIMSGVYCDNNVIWFTAEELSDFGTSSRFPAYLCAYDIKSDKIVRKYTLDQYERIDRITPKVETFGPYRKNGTAVVFFHDWAKDGNGHVEVYYRLDVPEDAPENAVWRRCTEDDLKELDAHTKWTGNDRAECERYAAYVDDNKNLVLRDKKTGSTKTVFKYSYDAKREDETWPYPSESRAYPKQFYINEETGGVYLLGEHYEFGPSYQFIYDCGTGEFKDVGIEGYCNGVHPMIFDEGNWLLCFDYDYRNGRGVGAALVSLTGRGTYQLFSDKIAPAMHAGLNDYFQSALISGDGKTMLMYALEKGKEKATYRLFDLDKFLKDRLPQDGIDTGITERQFTEDILIDGYELRMNGSTWLLLSGDGWSFSCARFIPIDYGV